MRYIGAIENQTSGRNTIFQAFHSTRDSRGPRRGKRLQFVCQGKVTGIDTLCGQPKEERQDTTCITNYTVGECMEEN